MKTAVSADVTMPRLSDSMEEGTIIAWLVEHGASVSVGDELVEIETDKATMTCQAEAAGVVRLVAGIGDTLPVGAVIARIGGEEIVGPATSDGPVEPTEAAPAASGGSARPASAACPADGTAPFAEGSASAAAGREVRASPLARRIADRLGISLDALNGSGPRGRILRADVERAAGIAPAPPPSSAPPSAPPATDPAPATAAGAPPTTGSRDGGAKGELTIEEITRLQQTVARRMAESKATAPEFVIGVEVDMENAVALRAEFKRLPGDARAPSYNDFIVKASALALREYPRANGSYRDGRFSLFGRVNVGVAVAANDALVVPTIFDADQKSLGQIRRESAELARRVRDGTITPPELSGGTFTVSNLGMFGIAEFIAVINPPQAAILSAGEVRRTPVEHDGEIALRHIVKLKLTCDHRILYGADAAGFLGRIRELLENPLTMSL